MVCKVCEKKLSKAAAPDPFRNRNAAGTLVSSGAGAGISRAGPSAAVGSANKSSSIGKAVGGNKLLGASKRYNPLGTRCKLCKQAVSQDKAQYCQACAYKKGLCSICGKTILDTKMYKQSVA
ncbi:hypothetical protein K437DRAFT_268206 [Tilletiaria anomala UBC 951]|uniref:Cysteine-rich PDZ-binding protein n=1 Tax=Tilletiaria anomala (strain ATCC 24038 / CBS 436.72 / UBC 951) TaxID=1037660 RepID=A0A066W0P3_TILAU|nr:uncharacterized protein K437DRAFT_268206 [Tilletiaria anomala UBC 951]KDN46123.1 hypothetical protein K437DRAFT_268206 [Tilletiaria anomala UBC 951]